MAGAARAHQDEPAEVTGIALERALRRNIVAGCLGWTFFGLVSGAFLTRFGQMLGLTKFQFGLLGALPMIVFPARLFASLLVERLGRRKQFFTATFAASRAVWLLVVLIPFVISPDRLGLRAGVFLGLLLVSNTLLAMGIPAWLSWLGDLVPADRRGRFWARRNALASAAPVLPMLVLSLMFDHMRAQGQELWAYVIIFGFAVVVGQIDLWIHYKIPEPKMHRVEGTPTLRRLVGEPLRQPNFRRFLYYVGVTTFSTMFLGHFSMLYLFKVFEGVVVVVPLGFATVHLKTFGFLAAIGVVNVALGVLLSFAWGYLIDRFGNKPLLRLLTLILVPLPLAWLFITPAHPFAATIPVFLIARIVYTAKQYMVINVLYALSPRANRTMYAAVHGVVFSIFGALSPILAGLIMQNLEGFETTLAGLHVGAFHVLCFITVGVRVFEQYVLGGLREPRSASAGTLIRQLVQANPFAVLPRAFSLASSAPPPARAKAVRKLGNSGSHLVTHEFVELLDDPNPDVRHEAALALGHTKDHGAVEPLVERLAHDDAEMRRQAAWALGHIGSGEAIQRLTDLLADPYPHVRSAAALALGQLGGEEAGTVLMELLATRREPLEFASLATALGLLGRAEAMAPILARMAQATQPVFRRQLAVAVGDLLGRRHSFYSFLDGELKVRGRRVVRSCRAMCRAARKLTDAGLGPAELEQLVAQLEGEYLDGEWAACARHLAELPERLASGAPERTRDLGLPAEYLQWLGEHAECPSPEAGLERCVLGIFALERLVARLTA